MNKKLAKQLIAECEERYDPIVHDIKNPVTFYGIPLFQLSPGKLKAIVAFLIDIHGGLPADIDAMIGDVHELPEPEPEPEQTLSTEGVEPESEEPSVEKSDVQLAPDYPDPVVTADTDDMDPDSPVDGSNVL